MIRTLIDEDIDKINLLGYQYDKKFLLHYDLKSYLNKSMYINLVFEDQNIIKGFLLATKLYETMEILLVYVDTTYRRLHIGEKLLKHLENYDNITKILLEVSVLNEPAINLYKKLGYQVINIRKKYYDGIDAYVMEKVLK